MSEMLNETTTATVEAITLDRKEEIKNFIKDTCLRTWPALYPDDRISENAMDSCWEEKYPLSKEYLVDVIAECRQELLEEQQSWTALTDCDRLDRVVEALDTQNILFVQHLDTTPSSCWLEINELISNLGASGLRYTGAAYFHFQSTEGALAHGKMHIYFGTTEAGDEQCIQSLSIRKAVVATLLAEGLQLPEFQSDSIAVKMDPVTGAFTAYEQSKPNREGGIRDAIEINPLSWQKRLLKL